MKITAEMAYQAWCVATFEEIKPWSQLYQSQQARFVVMADYLNGQLAPDAREPEQESGWYDCATPDCGAQVRVSGSLCEACQACEDLGFAASSDHNALDDGFHGVDEPCDHAQPPEERSRYATLYSDDPTYGQFNL